MWTEQTTVSTLILQCSENQDFFSEDFGYANVTEICNMCMIQMSIVLKTSVPVIGIKTAKRRQHS